MAKTPSPSLRPFASDTMLSGRSLESLCEWLSNNVPQTLQLTVDYTVADLVIDLDKMLDGMWSDGIDQWVKTRDPHPAITRRPLGPQRTRSLVPGMRISHRAEILP